MAFTLQSQSIINTWRPRSADPLYHYTRIENLPHFIDGSLRLSPFASLNDPTEFAPIGGLKIANYEQDKHRKLKKELESARQKGHVACFSQGTTGYAIAPMWAHYGGNHAGCCIVFDRAKLIEKFQQQFSDSFLHKTIEYQRLAENNTIQIDSGFDGDASEAARLFSEQTLWFRKNECWSYESEYRFVVKNQNEKFVYLDIADTVIGLFVGCNVDLKQMQIAMSAGKELSLDTKEVNVTFWDRGNPRHQFLGAYYLAEHARFCGYTPTVPEKHSAE